MGDFDLFYAGHDFEPLGRAMKTLAVSSGAATCLAEGFSVPLTTAPVEGYINGQLVSFTDGVKTVYCRVIKQVTGGSPSVFLKPIQTTLDSAGVIGHEFASLSVVLGTVRQDAFTLVIDLSDAPDGTYDYVILSSGGVVGSSVGQLTLGMLSKSLVDDPMAGDGASFPDAAVWTNASTSSVEPFNCVDVVSLQAGQRYEFRLMPAAVSADLVHIINPRILALRYDTINQASQISQVTTTSSSAVDILTLSSLPAGTYLVLAGWLTQGSLNGSSDEVSCRVRNTTAGETLGRTLYAGVATSDYYSGGYAAVHTFGVTTTLTLQHFVLSGSGTARTKNARLIALPLPPAFESMVGRNPANGTNASLVAESWNDMLDSDQGTSALSLDSGTYVELISFGNAMAQEVRPKWGGDVFESTRRGRAYAEQPAGVGMRSYGNFWIHRGKRIQGNGKNTLQVRPPAATTSLDWRNVRFGFLKEREVPEITDRTEYSFAAELELCVAYKKWSPAGTDVWKKSLPTVGLVTRVIVNGKDYARVTSSPTAAETFFWDISSREVTIKMLSGDSPADNDRIVLVGEPILAGRDPEVFEDDDGVMRPYDARLVSPPSVDETLDIKAEGTEVGSRYGTLSLVLENDPDRKVPHFDGMRIRVKRGRRGVHTKLKDLPPLIAGRMQRERRRPDEGEFSVELLDRSLILQTPIAQTVVSVYSGSTQREDYLLPVLYGTLRRVPARRTTDNGSGTNTFKVASHAVKNLGAIQSNGTFQAKAYIDGTELTPSVASITATLTSASFTVPDSDVDNWQSDVLYVDVQGMCADGPSASSGALLERPGEISRHILLTYGGFVSTQLVEPSFRLMDRKWRIRRKTTGPVPLGIKIGLYLTEQTVRDALNTIARTAFCYWTETRAGRIRLGVPDAEAADILGNNGFEEDSSSIYPWRHGELATSALSTALKYEGTRALQLSNGQTVVAPKPYGDLRQSIICSRPGLYALTKVVSLQNGEGSACRLGFISPGDGLLRQLSTAVQIVSEQWMRLSAVFEVEDGASGTGTVLVLPYAPEGYEPPLPTYGSNIAADWDADAITGLASGDPVSQWDDISGNGKHATQGTASRRPKYVPDAVAGHAAVLFDDQDDTLTSSLSLSIPCTVIAVYAYRSSLSKLARVVHGSNGWLIGPYQGVNRGYVGTGFVPNSGSPTIDPFMPVVVTLRQASASSSELFVNGVSVGTQTAGSQVGPGTVSLSVNTEPANAYVLRVLCFSAAIASQRRIFWEQYLMKRYGIVPTSVNIDNAECFRVAAKLEAIDGNGPGLNAKVREVSVRRDHFFAARVPYNPNLQDRGSDVGVIRTDSEARGLISSYDPDASEARGALPASGRINLDGVIVSGATETEGKESSRGVANYLAAWFGRQRQVSTVGALGLTVLPELGERVFHEKIRGIPRTPDDYPIQLVTGIEDENDPASEVTFELERESDPISDRHEIAPTEIPLGAIGFCLDSSCPPDYDEVTDQRGFYAAGAAVPNLSSVFGFLHHEHDASHEHPFPNHGHTAQITGNALGASKKAVHEFPAADEDTQARQPLFTTSPVARGKTSGDHGHPTSGTITYVSASGTSSRASLSTYRGPNDVKYRRGLFCRRARNDNAAIPATMIFGFVEAAAPTGWNLCDGNGGRPDMQGYAPRGADPGNTGVSSRAITSAHTQSDSANGGLGGWIVCSLASVNLYDRVTVTDGSKTYHGLVSSIDQPNGRFTLQPSHETGDSVDGSSYASGTTTVTIASSDVNTTFTPSDHLHVRSGADGTGAIPPHQHSAEHEHKGVSAAPTVGVPTATDTTCVQESDALPAESVASDVHPHTLTKLALPKETGSSAVQSSSPYGGTIAEAVQNKPPVLRLPFIISDGAQTQEPAGLVFLFEQSSCPLGHTPIDLANGRLIVGATAGQAMSAEDGGHDHDVTYVAHVFLHRHVSGGAYNDTSDAVLLNDSFYQSRFVGLDTDHVSTGTEDTGGGTRLYGHAHDVPVSNVQNVDPTLSQVTGATGISSGAVTMPVNRRFRLCQKS